jgi:glutathionylspermidine synthase
MERLVSEPRPGWQNTVDSQGLIYHTPNGRRYWDEGACYRFRAWQVDELERATNELQELCLKAGQHIIDRDRFGELGIPAAVVPAIVQAWSEEPPAVYGRFDFTYDGKTPPKLLEYNADTPTALLEAAVIQWYWLQDLHPQSDQFNSIHERLIAKWKDLADYIPSRPLHFAHIDNPEDAMTVSYLRDTAEQAGIRTCGILMKDIGWAVGRREFVDLDNKPIRAIFKLYPWEWMIREEFGRHALELTGQVQWIEPIWKMLFSNKGILAILWELFPGHANLLEAYMDQPCRLREYVQKPKLSREGANVTLVTVAGNVTTPGKYGEEGYVYQAIARTPEFNGNRAVIGSWVIDGQSAGMGIRESDGPITDNLSRFVPHYFE